MEKIAKKHITKKWEITLTELNTKIGKVYKITRNLPELSTTETRIFKSKNKAKELFNEWLN